MNGDMAWVVPPGVEHTIHWNRRAPLLHIYLNDQFFKSTMEKCPTKPPPGWRPPCWCAIRSWSRSAKSSTESCNLARSANCSPSQWRR